MVRKLCQVVGAALMVAVVATALHAGAKVKVCHIPPGNPENFHTITVGENALSAHLAHGDLAGSCFGNAEALCDDGDACTIDAMDPETETCLTDHPPVDCEDGLNCTSDTCDPAVGCQSAPIVCDDGDACTIDTCSEFDGQCVGTPIDCGSLGVCLPETGLCDYPCDGITCDPIDQCHEAGECVLPGECVPGVSLADGTECDDGNPDTINDQCSSGVCAGALVPACPCEGLSQGLASWDSSFPTSSCFVGSNGSVFLFGPNPEGDYRRLAALPPFPNNNCNVWDGTPGANSITYSADEQFEACVDSLVALAAEDGVVCD